MTPKFVSLLLFCLCLGVTPLLGQPSELPSGNPSTLIPHSKRLPNKPPASVQSYFEIIKARLIAIDSELMTNSEGLDIARGVEWNRKERTRMKIMVSLGAVVGACASFYCLSDAGAQMVHRHLPSAQAAFDTARQSILDFPTMRWVLPLLSALPGASIGALIYIFGANLVPNSQDPMLAQSFVEIRKVDLLYQEALSKKAAPTELLKDIHGIERPALLRVRELALHEISKARKKDGSGAQTLQVKIRYAQALAAISSLTAAALAKLEAQKDRAGELFSLAQACGQRAKPFLDDLDQASSK